VLHSAFRLRYTKRLQRTPEPLWQRYFHASLTARWAPASQMGYEYSGYTFIDLPLRSDILWVLLNRWKN